MQGVITLTDGHGRQRTLTMDRYVVIWRRVIDACKVNPHERFDGRSAIAWRNMFRGGMHDRINDAVPYTFRGRYRLAHDHQPAIQLARGHVVHLPGVGLLDVSRVRVRGLGPRPLVSFTERGSNAWLSVVSACIVGTWDTSTGKRTLNYEPIHGGDDE